jgi:hypothetical protein|tara:strand:- start:10 stop:213 length:204 start_codon:yes stop_codon:yes gene_type:complete
MSEDVYWGNSTMIEEIKIEKTKLEQIQFRFQFMSLLSAAGRHDEMNKSFGIAQDLVNELVEEEKQNG